jgi:dihydropteroate synthase
MSVVLRACGVTHELRGRPWLMGIVNATPDSFSDAGLHPTLDSRLALAVELVAAGARVIDVGGESGVTNRPVVAAAEEIERVVPLVERVAASGSAATRSCPSTPTSPPWPRRRSPPAR